MFYYHYHFVNEQTENQINYLIWLKSHERYRIRFRNQVTFLLGLSLLQPTASHNRKQD